MPINNLTANERRSFDALTSELERLLTRLKGSVATDSLEEVVTVCQGIAGVTQDISTAAKQVTATRAADNFATGFHPELSSPNVRGYFVTRNGAAQSTFSYAAPQMLGLAFHHALAQAECLASFCTKEETVRITEHTPDHGPYQSGQIVAEWIGGVRQDVKKDT